MLPVGTLLLGKTYRVELQLGSGGFGNTYVVRKVYFDETYVMKEFFMRGINMRDGNDVTVSVPDNHATFESQREKFKKEALRLRDIHSPHIVRVHDLFEENGTVYYVMDYIKGESLERHGKPLTEHETMDVCRQVLQALKVIHSQTPQMLHLDIKPANLLRDGSGQVFLIDFGSSKQIDAEQGITVSSGITLTKGYAPSELEDGRKERIGAWTDLYELGATLYNLLTCKLPPTTSEIVEDGAQAFVYPWSVSAATKELITWMMTPNRHKRPQTVEEVDARINAFTVQPTDEETTFSKPSETRNTDNEDTTFFKTTDNSKPVAEEKESEGSGRIRFSYKWLLALAALLVVCISVWMLWPKATPISSPNEVNVEEARSQSDILQDLVANMVRVEGGTFTMGATSEQGSDASDDEKPAHQVTLSSFSIGKYEVTQEEWQAVMGSNPSNFKGAKRPVEQVSWTDCQEFIRKLNLLTGKRFRLPTEAEWEYAARGGSRSVGYKYAGSDNLGSVAWFDGNSGNVTHSVGQKSPNELGLYDMSGNVSEWCQDWHGSYSSSSQTNPSGRSSGSNRVFRGGCWNFSAGSCRSSCRDYYSPSLRFNYLGLRLAL